MHPYMDLPDHCYWSRAVARKAADEIDPAIRGDYTISRQTPVLTAGSCFAERITSALAKTGYELVVTEPPHPALPAHISSHNGYGRYGARYGNIYTARQLLQLLERALGLFTPHEPPWRMRNGLWADPFRPTIQPGGFESVEELEADRTYHLAAVRSAFERAEVFIFTLGLTEAWQSLEDGAVFPVAPGVAAGRFDRKRHGFIEFSAEDVIRDLKAFLRLARHLKPGLRVILTVSPVPLAATAIPSRHVLSATTLSKSKLRIAAEEICKAVEGVSYFPAYEIVTSPHGRGRHFGKDLRSVTPLAVDRVMRAFFRNFTESGEAALERSPTPKHSSREKGLQPSASDQATGKALFEAACEETLNDIGAHGEVKNG